jgi:hypothetical protein
MTHPFSLAISLDHHAETLRTQDANDGGLQELQRISTPCSLSFLTKQAKGKAINNLKRLIDHGIFI